MLSWLRKLLRRKDRLTALENKIDGLEGTVKTLISTVDELKAMIGEKNNG